MPSLSSLASKLSVKGQDLTGKLKDKLDDASLQDVRVRLVHKKHQLGKLTNLCNPGHRHDEEHEKACDEKRTRISESHRFQSYFPERDGNMIKWYVDGRNYFWAVSVAIEKAKESIYIADWWLSPELFLRRPPHHNQEWRLDKILKRKAEQGVKIFVMVYREVQAALTCNSQHTKYALQSLCPKGSPGYGNIKVMRHPDHDFFENAADMTLYWAHHEKFIVIDYELAFIGGLDLCFGRWDVHQHPLADAHPEGVAEDVWPGQDFNNNRIMDFKNVDHWKQNELSKVDHGRMPWHDVAMGIIGPCVYDIAEHFVLGWNFVKRDKYKRNKRYDWLMLEGRTGEDEDLVGVQRPVYPVGEYIQHPLSSLSTKGLDCRGTVHAQIVRSSADWSSGILTEHSVQNAFSQTIRSAKHYVYLENQYFITATGDQQSPIHNTIGRAIVDAVVEAGKKGRKFRVIIIIPAIPGFAGDLRDNAAAGTRAIMDYQYKSICRGEHSIFEQIKKEGVDPYKHIFFFNLRSYDRINKNRMLKKQEEESGVKYQEAQRAHAEEIMPEGTHGSRDPATGHDKHMGCWKNHSGHGTKAGEEPMEKKKRFDEVQPEGQETTTAFTVAHCAMADAGSVVDQPWDGSDREEVDNWIQEELYVHAKLLIVDDRIVLCGSSNLNDRSQVGHHDSELSIVMEDTRMLQSKMDGKPYEAGWHAATLRRYLWREHLGLLPPQDLDAKDDPNAQPPGDSSPNDPWDRDDSWGFVEDPMSDDVWNMWTSQADKNTEIFRHLFHADPDDNAKTFEDYDLFFPPRGVKSGHIFDRFIPAEDIRRKLDQVKGHLVWMPLDFLKDTNMANKGLQVNPFTESVYT